YGVSFIDANAGSAVGGDGIHGTADGGATWTQVWGSGQVQLNAVSFVDANNGIAVGCDTNVFACDIGSIVRTSDGGATWGYRADYRYPLVAVSFLDVNSAVASDVSGTILHTTNGGSTWTTQYGALVNAFSFVDANTGWAVGFDGVILHTTTGGD